MAEHDVRSYTWTEMQGLCEGAAKAIHDNGFRPTVIVPILRGGCFPGLVLSHALAVRRLCPLRVATTLSDDIRAERMPPRVDIDTDLPITSQDVLLVDDVTNTGATLRAAKGALQRASPRSMLTVALVWDTVGTTQADARCEADIFVDKIAAWAQFPWEKVAKL